MTKLIAALIIASIATTAWAYCITGYFRRSYNTTIAGNYVQVCVYDVNGDNVDIIYSATQICPLTKDFCF